MLAEWLRIRRYAATARYHWHVIIEIRWQVKIFDVLTGICRCGFDISAPSSRNEIGRRILRD
ncbi:hypothetical protein I545_3240 [Mycobacterium kansasii 662]|uniref:Uncharacterized protein n=2 Tax=Mycobacterium kansasii TaxID=1768 RepID=A0A1V3WVS4_MYCKA|nr:hypothetical protein I547_5838 [Mycobacterium kansasii 824]EUA18006.1 hypothetical protein I545_3240 [Mycobacterium kansasii 662]KEP39521.1 hypothetical protein MKSMC1_53400 [Mycobacterium kansasii]OOK70421.1 hypothetical protein BZL30_6034 [Mycobacterium kansasii]OOK74545.1 hypothetical protein BZL29_4102 [Mycobacterium kansasii]